MVAYVCVWNIVWYSLKGIINWNLNIIREIIIIFEQTEMILDQFQTTMILLYITFLVSFPFPLYFSSS